MLNHLDLFSGIGGFSLASQWVGGIHTTQFVEIDSQVQSVLKKRFPKVPIYGDVSTFNIPDRRYDIITAGFPCQEISVASHGVGLDGERSGLFYEVIRTIRQYRPRYCVLENVAALLTSNKGRDMRRVLWELSQSGYDAEWEIIPASALGANHKRERIWIVAYPNSLGRSIEDWAECPAIPKREFLSTNNQREELCPTYECPQLSSAPRLGDIAKFPRAYDGLSRGMDESERRMRIRALGNSISPQVGMVPLQRVVDLESQFN